MELKDAILSALAEMEDVKQVQVVQTPKEEIVIKSRPLFTHKQKSDEVPQQEMKSVVVENDELMQDMITDVFKSETSTNEKQFLLSIRERMLVLFEGFQAPNNANIESKIDLTLNFLEYMLSMIDTRVEEIEKEHR